MRLIIRDVEAASSSLATPINGNFCVSRGSLFVAVFQYSAGVSAIIAKTPLSNVLLGVKQ